MRKNQFNLVINTLKSSGRRRRRRRIPSRN
jgi:hypothetical protein